MRALYSLSLYLAVPLILLHMAVRGLKDRAYLRRWNERFALFEPPAATGGIVIQAASVGELNAAIPLINALSKRSDALALTVTTFTPTGSARVQAIFGDRVFHSYAPLDLPGAVRRFLEHTRPRLLIIMETEIWPNLYHQASRRNIPILLANARISNQSMKAYQRFKSLARPALEKVSHASAQSATDAERLIACGADPGRVLAAGNLKFDISIPAGLTDQARALRNQWGAERPVLIAGSTHKDDDEAVLTAFGGLLEQLPDALLILVPRHPERFGTTATLARDTGLRTELRSEGSACSRQAQCFVIDAMGELLRYYACSDVAIIGGSFGPVGGHNALEASALEKAVIVGPNTVNFTDITERLIRAGAVIRVRNAAELERQATALLFDPERRQAMGRAGLALVNDGKGALQHTLAVVDRLLGQSRI